MYLPRLNILLFLSCTYLQITFSQSESIQPDSVIYKGINFVESDDWGEILALAELEDKVIFLDAYTSWCRPCKEMDKKVFSRPDVGELYNGNFLNVKMNMERGDGVNLVQKYQIIVYPTLLFIDGDGTIIHRVTGYKGPGKMLELGRQVEAGENTVASLDERYLAGERSPDFLYQYLMTSIEAGDGRQTILLEEYLATQEDWATDATRKLIFETLDSPESSLFDHIIKNKSAYSEQFGVSKVENKIQNLVFTTLRKAEEPLAIAPTLFERVYPDKAEFLTANYQMNHYRDAEDGKNYAKVVNAYLSSNSNIDETAINEIAWNYYDLVSDKTALKPFFKKVKRLRKSADTYLNNESLALLYAKMGKSEKAKKLTEKAIAIATTEKISAASSKDLLAELASLD